MQEEPNYTFAEWMACEATSSCVVFEESFKQLAEIYNRLEKKIQRLKRTAECEGAEYEDDGQPETLEDIHTLLRDFLKDKLDDLKKMEMEISDEVDHYAEHEKEGLF
jgi:hypothetical protein